MTSQELREAPSTVSKIARHQMVLFVVLSYLLSWALVVPARGGLIAHGPMIAAFIVLALVGGRSAVRGLLRSMARWRVSWRWYLAAPGVLLAVHMAAFGANVLLGAEIVSTVHIGSLLVYLGGTFLPLLLLGGQWEEPGWTGYALRRMSARFVHSVLLAVLVVGLIRMLWHIPLLAYGTIPWFDVVFGLLALQVIFAWLYFGSSGSVLIVMICHLFSNVLTATFKPMFSPADQGQYWLLMVLGECLLALILLVATRGRLGYAP